MGVAKHRVPQSKRLRFGACLHYIKKVFYQFMIKNNQKQI
jgi:hypothetical protein